ncbi:MAG: DNA-binding protein [Lachnospiraceae bacterium]|nr:DNA-binding protein [Lachnospiraceae bacterium]MBQ9642997.1 DNA-binding protein [Lachnospiraceae bacterium]
MEKIVAQGLLYDFYGQLLTRHQQEIYEKAVYEDLSLSEIAAVSGISKQAVHDLIRRATAQMDEYESRLHMIERHRKITEAIRTLQEAAGSESGQEALKQVMLETARKLEQDLA